MDGAETSYGAVWGILSLRHRTTDGDMEIIARVAVGDEDALEKVYARFGNSLFRYLLTLTSDRRLAEEILQDTLVAVWRGANTYRGRSSVKTWIFGIARRQAHNTLRGRSLPLAVEEELRTMPVAERGPEESLLVATVREELARNIGFLSPLHREVLDLIFFHELSYEEAAEVVGVPVGTIKSRLSNAKRALRKLLDASEELKR